MAKKIYIGSNEELEVLQYIESTGTQYIDTGISITTALSFECEWEKTATGAGLNGSYYYIDSTTKAFCFGLYSDEKLYVGVGSTTNTATAGSLNTKYKTIGNSTSMTTYQNDVSKVSITGSLTKNNLNFYLFATHRNQESSGVGTGYYGQYRIYSCKLYENNILVRDFVPVLDERGKAFLWDRVSQTKFFNKGTGDFIAGEVASDFGKINIKNNPREVKTIYTTENRGFKPLQYIESTGTQYIDTGISGDAIGTYEIKFNMLGEGYQNYEMYFAGPLSAQVPKLYLNGDTAVVADIGTAAYDLFTKDNNSHIIKVTDTEILCDDIVKATYEAKPWGDQSFWLFNAAEQPSLYSTMRLYYLKMYSGGVLIRDFIPIQDEEGNICLYDEVSQTKFLNQGTGNFIAGPQNSPAKKVIKGYVGVKRTLQVLNYLESTSMQYIDTGIIPNQNTKIEIDLQSMSSITSNVYIGGRAGFQDNAFYISQQYGDGEDIGYRFAYGTETYDVPNTYQDVNRHLFVLDKNKAYIDNTLVKTFTEQTFSSPVSLWIFTGNNNGASLQPALMKLYSCKIYDNDVLIRDFVPVLNNKKACLYDKVSKKLFYNRKKVNNFIIGNEMGETIIANIAEKFFGDKTLEYMGVVNRTTYVNYSAATASTNNYFISAGGRVETSGSPQTQATEAFDTNFIKTTTTAATARIDLFSGSIGGYALFMGGVISSTYSKANLTTAVEAFDDSLVKKTCSAMSQVRYGGAGGNAQCAFNDKHLMIFGGGQYSSVTNVVESYDVNLTKTSATSLSNSRKLSGCTRAGDYLICAGGSTSTSASGGCVTNVDAYSNDLVKSTCTGIDTAVVNVSGAWVGDYGIIVGGNQSSESGTPVKQMCIYDKDLSKRTTMSFPVATSRNATATINDGKYVLIGAGRTGSSDAWSYPQTQYVYDKDLVLINTLSTSGMTGDTHSRYAVIGDMAAYHAYGTNITAIGFID